MSLYRTAARAYHLLPGPVRDLIARSPLRRAKELVVRTLPSHEERYDAAYYAELDRSASRSSDAMAHSIVRDLAPRRVIDVGCGTGALLAALARRAVSGEGLEYSSAGILYCRERGLNVTRFDLEQGMPPGLTPPYDVVISMEVAEHLPERMAGDFVRLLTSLGGTVVFTAATPGQGGINHVNEQPHEYWLARFAAAGFAFDAQRSLAWRLEWTREKRAFSWYRNNLMIFRRQNP